MATKYKLSSTTKVEQKWQKSREVNKLRDVDQDDDDGDNAADD